MEEACRAYWRELVVPPEGGGWVWGAIETYRQPSGVLASVIDARPLMILLEFCPSPTILNSVIATTASLPAGTASLTVMVSCPPTFLNSSAHEPSIASRP
jgi:hypothetical protein